jgi:hypothetical protein
MLSTMSIGEGAVRARRSCPPAPLLLLVRELEDSGEAALVVPASVARLELRDQLLQLGHHQVDALAAEDVLPLVGDALPPPLRYAAVDAFLEDEGLAPGLGGLPPRCGRGTTSVVSRTTRRAGGRPMACRRRRR